MIRLIDGETTDVQSVSSYTDFELRNKNIVAFTSYDILLLCQVRTDNFQWMSLIDGGNRWTDDTFTAPKYAIEEMIAQDYTVIKYDNYGEMLRNLQVRGWDMGWMILI